MAKVMVTFEATQPPSIDDLKRRFGLTDGEIDEAFGVIEIDPDARAYTIRVEESAARRITGGAESSARGPFADPKIEPFGPPSGRK